MEKKTILAFVLSLAVLIVWSVLFAPQPAQKTDSPAKEGTAPSQPAPTASPQVRLKYRGWRVDEPESPG
jgi:hypothetical protein